LVEAFEYWQKYDEFMVLKDTDVETNKTEYFAVKCSKRGNDYYNYRLEKKLKFLKSFNVELFTPDDFKEKDELLIGPGCLLWVTLTNNSNRCSLDEAWLLIMAEFNEWITKIRQKYGRVWYVSFPQPYPGEGAARGYPHMHVLMLFEDACFTVFPHLEEDRAGELKMVYRVKEKDELHENGDWHSFIDVKALRSGLHAYNYTVKYTQNVIMGAEAEKSTLTNAILWLYRKKSFNLSGQFRRAYSDLINGDLHNSKVFQSTFEGDLLPEASKHVVEFYGIYGLDEIKRVKQLRDPPGWVFLLNSDEVKALDANRGKAIYDC
jgi:hypothetical protein